MNRLGSNGPDEVKNHPWLEDFPWDKLNDMEYDPPFVPPATDNYDLLNSLSHWNDENEEHFRHSLQLLKRESV